MQSVCVVLSPPHSQLDADKSKMKTLTFTAVLVKGYMGVGLALRILRHEVQIISKLVSPGFGHPNARAIHMKPPHPNSYFIEGQHLCGTLRTKYFLVGNRKAHNVA